MYTSKLKKVLSCSLSLAFALNCLGVSAFAVDYEATQMNDQIQNIIDENDEVVEITYENSLKDCIENEDNIWNKIQVLNTSNMSDLNMQASDHEELGYGAIDFVIQDQILQSENSNAPAIHAVTTASAIIPMAFDGQEITKRTYDSTVSVQGYCTIYYYEKDVSGMTYYCFVRTSGGYSIIDSSVRVASQEVIYGQNGILQPRYQEVSEKYPTSSSWSYDTGYTDYVFLTEWNNLGVTYNMTLQRTSGSSQWSYQLMNQIWG